ncbi:MAG: cell envelope integrity protein TolA [Candidatus Aquirickettsiella sp.]
MLSQVNKEDYRYSLAVAIVLHIVLMLALFLTLHPSTKLLWVSPPPLQVIHATAIPMDSLLQKSKSDTEKIKPLPTAVAKTLSKPVLLEKSPVLLAIKEKKRHKAEQDKITPLKVPYKQASLIKKGVPAKTKPSKVLSNTEKKMANKHLKPSKASLKLVAKNVQQLLDQEMASLAQQQINAARNAATTDKYRHLILQAIAQQWIIPPEMNKHLETKLTVHLAPGGMVLEVIIVKSSGNSVLDRSAQTAVYKASPLPIPKKSSLFQTFQLINLTVRPEGVLTQ